MKKLFMSLICLPAFLSLAHASTISVYNDLPGDDAYTGYSVYLDGYYSTIGGSFSTPDIAGLTLDDVELTLLASAPSDGGTLNVDLYSDSSTAPGTNIASLGSIDDSALTTSPADYTFDPTGTVDLSADTRYWVVLSTSDESSAALSMTDTFSDTVGNENYWDSFDGSGNNGDTGLAFEMQVNADYTSSSAPEPSTILLGITGLASLIAFRRRRTVS